MAYILALDQGTTSSRATPPHGAIRDGTKKFRQIYPQPGWVEHDPREIWTSQLACARAALRRAGVAARQIAAIGISNQRETVVLWDRSTGQPVHNAIVWQDRRTAALCERLKRDGFEPLLRKRTGLMVDPTSRTKIATPRHIRACVAGTARRTRSAPSIPGCLKLSAPAA
jgi:glycerol kinase